MNENTRLHKYHGQRFRPKNFPKVALYKPLLHLGEIWKKVPAKKSLVTTFAIKNPRYLSLTGTFPCQ